MGVLTFAIIIVVGAVGVAFFFPDLVKDVLGDEIAEHIPVADKDSVLKLFQGHTLDGDNEKFDSNVDSYNTQFEAHQQGTDEGDTSIVDYYYNMATDFYEYGWGTSFHFAHTRLDESHDDSIARHEHYLADVLELKPGMLVLDAGCGVGGPAREIARHSGAKVMGVTLNNYQVQRARNHTLREGLTDDQVEFRQMDYTKLDFPDNHFDAVYTIESTCHAPTLQDVYSEIYRVLKPGGHYAGYNWIAASDYDKDDEEHKKIMWAIEYGSGLPPLRTLDDALQALKDTGLSYISDVDLAQDKEGTRVWYHKLDMEWWRYKLTHLTCWLTEIFGMAPSGTLSMHGVLLNAAEGLVLGGKANCFTPMHVIHAMKPL